MERRKKRKFLKLFFAEVNSEASIMNKIFNSSFVFFLPTDPPEVILTLGSTLNPDDIKENDDVYFECNVKANPSSVKISWSHDVSLMITFLWVVMKYL